MSHRTACGGSQVRIDSGPVALCGPVSLSLMDCNAPSVYCRRRIRNVLVTVTVTVTVTLCGPVALYLFAVTPEQKTGQKPRVRRTRHYDE